MARKPKTTAPTTTSAETELNSLWVAINPSTYPGQLTVAEHFHLDEEHLDNWIDARDDQGRCHMMTEKQLIAQYMPADAIAAPVVADPEPQAEPEPEVEAEPAPEADPTAE